MHSRKQSLNLLADKENLIALVGVELFESHLFAAVAFFEKKLEKKEIIVADGDNLLLRIFLPPEALGLGGRSRVFNLELPYATFSEKID